MLLRRGADGFLVADEGSTNGTYVEGRKLAAGEERLVQAALFEVGHTFFHLRAAARGAREAPGDEGMGDPLTWNPEFALTLAAAGRLARRAHDLLLTGESGVGKEVVARWLHHVSERQGALVAVNCAALPEHLLEDELFGHLRGAFSGAHSDRPGLIRAAHEGMLLLDEIGDMPLPLQAKLLRVIEGRRVRPVGGEREVPVDVPRLEEWAYAGIFFDLTGAATSHAISGDPPGRIATPLVLLLIAAASWALRPPSRTLKSDSTLPKSAGVVVSPEDVAAHA